MGRFSIFLSVLTIRGKAIITCEYYLVYSYLYICITFLAMLFQKGEGILFTSEYLILTTIEHHIEEVHLFNKYYEVPIKS